MLNDESVDKEEYHGRRPGSCAVDHSRPSESNQPIELIDAAEVAQIFGVSISTVYRWVHEGHLPAVLIGRGTYRFSRAQIIQMSEPQILAEAATYQQIAGEFMQDEQRARRGAEQENRDTSD